MYRVLIFLYKVDEDFLNYFVKNFIPILSDINGQEVKLAKVESNIILEQKFSHFCEITANSKDEMNLKLSSSSGKKLSILLINTHSKLSIINISYE
jgi:hypothetical protein